MSYNICNKKNLPLYKNILYQQDIYKKIGHTRYLAVFPIFLCADIKANMRKRETYYNYEKTNIAIYSICFIIRYFNVCMGEKRPQDNRTDCRAKS